MSNELVINSTQQGGRIALLRDKNLVELHYDKSENKFNVGDIYLGTVKKIVPGLNAAFIDIGYEKDAFLHYLDLGPRINTLLKQVRGIQSSGKPSQFKLSDLEIEPEIDKLGKINEVFKQNQRILVQVAKEPISTKGPRLSCELSLAGRYIVLVPYANSVNISKKVSDANERKRLQRLMMSIKPKNFGVIIRTVAEGKEVAELDRDLRDLLSKWEKGMQVLADAKPRQMIIGEMGKATSMLRDLLNESFDSITVDNETAYEEIRDFIRNIAPDKERIVKHYSGKTKIFETFGIEKQLKFLFGKTVSLPKGGYLIIEHTEALHVVDVNSGNKSSKEEDQEATALSVNLQAASEVARQLRLRDMGGIIVVDFIDMKKAENRKAVYDHMKSEMKTDRAKHTILPLSKFGLLQITRQRVKPELNIVTREVCPSCNGTGKISASITVTDQILSDLDYILTKQNEKKLLLIVHPFVFSFFTKGLYSHQMKWYFKYFKWVNLVKDSSLGIVDYKFMNQNNEEIKLK